MEITQRKSHKCGLIYGMFYSQTTYLLSLFLVVLPAVVPIVEFVSLPYTTHCVILWNLDLVASRDGIAYAEPDCQEQWMLSPILAGSVGISSTFTVVVAGLVCGAPDEYLWNRYHKRLCAKRPGCIPMLWLQSAGLLDYWKRLLALKNLFH